MARRKNLTLKEQLEETNQNILIAEENLENLKNTKKVLEEQIKEQDIKELYQAIIQSGKSVEDVIKQLATA